MPPMRAGTNYSEPMNATPSNLELSESSGSVANSQRRRTLLIVDDEEGPRQSIRFVFKDEYEILMADNGTKAMELARDHQIDAAVLDIRMSGMSGIDVLKQLKGIDSTIEVVMLT